MTTDLLAGPGGEPAWHLCLDDPAEIVTARGHWTRIVDEMRAGGRWSPVNDPAVERLVLAYLLYDRSARQVLEHGAIGRAKKTGVPTYNLHFTVMNDAARLAAQLEGELLLSPRKRGKVPMRKVGGGGAGVGPKAL